MRLVFTLVGLLVVVAIVLSLARQQLAGLGGANPAGPPGGSSSVAADAPMNNPAATVGRRAAEDIEQSMQQAADARASAADR